MKSKTDDNDIVVGIDKDKNSQYALKWAADHLVGRDRHITLLHVKPKTSTIITSSGSHLALCEVNEEVAQAFKSTAESLVKEIFLPFKVFCTRKNLQVNEVILEDHDIVTALCNYVKMNSTKHLVLGAQTRNYFSSLFKSSDIPGSVTKEAPEFCNVYVINKGKIASVRHGVGEPPAIETPKMPSSRSAPNLTTLGTKLGGAKPKQSSTCRSNISSPKKSGSSFTRDNVAPRSSCDISSKQSKVSTTNNVTSRSYCDISSVQSKVSTTRDIIAPRSYFDISSRQSKVSATDNVTSRSYCDASSVQSSLSSTSNSVASRSYGDISNAQLKVSFTESNEPLRPSHPSNYSVPDFRSSPNSPLSNISSHATNDVSKFSSYTSEVSGEYMDEVEVEMRRLKEEIKQKMEMYKAACEETETLTAKHKAVKSEEVMEATKAGKKTTGEKGRKKVLDVVANSDVRYHRYTIEEIEVATDYFSSTKKIGEGGYGPVYKCNLNNTPAAIKVLSPDTVHGMSQFHQEVEVLSNIRHPNMVHLLGACPENGCLVYEYMENGSLEDCLFGRGNNPALSWQARFRISAEIATALLFLHQIKPEPLVHRDLKPGNILLDQNYVSKISDVGLARLVPARVADTETIYRITKTAGTYCYIDPEYQLTGMLGTKSDVYSFGVMLLQIITGKSPVSLTHQVENAIATGTLSEVLDTSVPDWPVDAALGFAKIALKCTELRRKKRPNIQEVLPELNRLRDLAQESLPHC